MDNWISVKDKLPDEDMSVIIACTNIEVTPFYMQRSYIVHDEFWHNEDKMFCLYEKEWTTRRWFVIQSKHRSIITHWMPRPNHPREMS
jgi:hypothetical protein